MNESFVSPVLKVNQSVVLCSAESFDDTPVEYLSTAETAPSILHDTNLLFECTPNLFQYWATSIEFDEIYQLLDLIHTQVMTRNMLIQLSHH